MTRGTRLGIATAVAAGWLTAAAAQPPGGPPPRHPDPLRAALDANGNEELDADEMQNAPQALAKLDADGNGIVDHDEFRPPPPPGRERPQGGARRGPPPEGRPPRGPEGDTVRPRRPPGNEGRGPGPFVDRALEFDADGDGKLDRAELEKLASEMRQRRPGGPGGDRGGDRGPGRRGPPADGALPPSSPAAGE
jgi:hypothetical protein